VIEEKRIEEEREWDNVTEKRAQEYRVTDPYANSTDTIKYT
jgi:hypothetical protein